MEKPFGNPEGLFVFNLISTSRKHNEKIQNLRKYRHNAHVHVLLLSENSGG